MRRTVPLLLVLTVLLPQAALAGEWYRCRSDRKVRTTCCCPAAPAGAHGQAQEHRTELRRTLCCELIRYEPRALRVSTETSSGARQAAPGPALVLAPPPGIGAAAACSHALAARATAPPAGPEPIYLRHASLLL